MGGLGCAPEVRQSRPWYKNGAPRPKAPLLRQNGPKNGPEIKSGPEPPLSILLSNILTWEICAV